MRLPHPLKGKYAVVKLWPTTKLDMMNAVDGCKVLVLGFYIGIVNRAWSTARNDQRCHMYNRHLHKVNEVTGQIKGRDDLAVMVAFDGDVEVIVHNDELQAINVNEVSRGWAVDSTDPTLNVSAMGNSEDIEGPTELSYAVYGETEDETPTKVPRKKTRSKKNTKASGRRATVGKRKT